MGYQGIEVENGKPIKMWTQGVPLEDEARKQLINTARMPFIYRHPAVMPDVQISGSGAGFPVVALSVGEIGNRLVHFFARHRRPVGRRRRGGSGSKLIAGCDRSC